MTRRKRLAGLALLVFVVAWAAARGLDAGVLFLAPAILLAAPLMLGRYAGEARLVALLRRASAIRRAPRRLGAARPLAGTLGHRELLARSLAVRPPPLLTT
ncbi:MAG: hypothetical protein ABR946_05485 [Solirubrobacteraceae bacterium]